MGPVQIFSESEAAGRYCRLVPIRASSTDIFYIPKPYSRHAIVNLGGEFTLCKLSLTVPKHSEVSSIHTKFQIIHTNIKYIPALPFEDKTGLHSCLCTLYRRKRGIFSSDVCVLITKFFPPNQDKTLTF